MSKIQKNIRLSKATLEKLARLKLLYGTDAEVVAVAIDRLDRHHLKSESTKE